MGFGDLDLKRHGTNTVLGIYIFLSTTLIFFAFNNFYSLHEDFNNIKEKKNFIEKIQTLTKLQELDTGNGVKMDSFILAVLEQTGVVNREKDIEPWIQVYGFYCVFFYYFVGFYCLFWSFIWVLFYFGWVLFNYFCSNLVGL